MSTHLITWSWAAARPARWSPPACRRIRRRRSACWSGATATWQRRRAADPPLAGPARGPARSGLHDHAAAARKRPHRPLAGQGAGRLLVAQHDDLVQALPRRLAGLGRPRLRRAGTTTHGPYYERIPGPHQIVAPGRPERDPSRLDRGLRRRALGVHRIRRLERRAVPQRRRASWTSATTPPPACARPPA